MVAEGRGVVLDTERRRKLATVAARRGVPITAVLGELIDRAYEATESQPPLGPPPSEQASSDLAERLRLVEELVEATVEDVPDPETLRYQLGRAYGPADLH
jgi:hypothetical protein